MQTLDPQSDLFAEVRPTGWLADVLRRVANPKRRRWNRYLRACRAIPASSPVAGSTSWDKINARRCALITREVAAGGVGYKRSAELEALQRVASARVAGGLVVDNFLTGRLLRRLKRASANTAVSQCAESADSRKPSQS